MNAKTNSNQKVRTSGRMQFSSAHWGAGSTFNGLCYSLPWGFHAEVSVQNTAPLSPWQHPRSRSTLRFCCTLFTLLTQDLWTIQNESGPEFLHFSLSSPGSVLLSTQAIQRAMWSRWRGWQSKPKCQCSYYTHNTEGNIGRPWSVTRSPPKSYY